VATSVGVTLKKCDVTAFGFYELDFVTSNNNSVFISLSILNSLKTYQRINLMFKLLQALCKSFINCFIKEINDIFISLQFILRTPPAKNGYLASFVVRGP
jgi:hypothetical protein